MRCHQLIVIVQRPQVVVTLTTGAFKTANSKSANLLIFNCKNHTKHSSSNNLVFLYSQQQVLYCIVLYCINLCMSLQVILFGRNKYGPQQCLIRNRPISCVNKQQNRVFFRRRRSLCVCLCERVSTLVKSLVVKWLSCCVQSVCLFFMCSLCADRVGECVETRYMFYVHLLLCVYNEVQIYSVTLL